MYKNKNKYNVGNIVACINRVNGTHSTSGVITKVTDSGYEILSVSYKSLNEKKPRLVMTKIVTIEGIEWSVFYLTEKCNLGLYDLGAIFGFDSIIFNDFSLNRNKVVAIRQWNEKSIRGPFKEIVFEGLEIDIEEPLIFNESSIRTQLSYRSYHTLLTIISHFVISGNHESINKIKIVELIKDKKDKKAKSLKGAYLF